MVLSFDDFISEPQVAGTLATDHKKKQKLYTQPYVMDSGSDFDFVVVRNK